MAWCPNCKHEYRMGIKVCADCGADLVEKLPEETDPEEAPSDAALFEEMMRAEREKAGESDGEEGTVDPGKEEGAEPFVPYQDSSDAAEDNRSSGWVLLGFGVAGFVVVILGLLGVIPFRFSNLYLFYGVMCAVFLLFIIMGIISLRNASVFERKAKSEHNLEKTLTEWALQNIRAEDIDAQIGAVSKEEAELMFFKRNALIAEKLSRQFVNLDPRFLDHLIDTKLYDLIFSPDAGAEGEAAEQEDTL
ncbi:MAG: 7TM-DISM domain-containing protein [Lachnospiraceae bacterium]|nr:7TM-DISM domain-containing protein [Lachnospiraceae bacterium]